MKGVFVLIDGLGDLPHDLLGGKTPLEAAGKPNLNAIAEKCGQFYSDIENSENLNEEEDQDGETNWEAIGTNRSREAGIVSAY